MSEIYAAIALIQSQKGYLLTSRRQSPHDFGLPGGKLDKGETALEAVRRELKEETGLDGFHFEQVYAEYDAGRLIAVFRADVDVDQVINPEDGLNVVWSDLKTILSDAASFKDFNTVMIHKLNIKV